MKKWKVFHQLLQQEIDPVLARYNFMLVDTNSNIEAAERMYALPNELGGISIDVIQRVRVDKNLLPIDLYWLRVSGGIRSQGDDNLLPINVISDKQSAAIPVESEKHMIETGWLYQNSEELQIIVSEVKTKLQSALEARNNLVN